MSATYAYSDYSLAGSFYRRYQYQLALAFLYSRRYNFRLLESHGHGFWGLVGEDLMKELSPAHRTICIPQLNYTSSIRTNRLSPETSVDTITPPKYTELIPDFTGAFLAARFRKELKHAFCREDLSTHSQPIPQAVDGSHHFTTVPRGYRVVPKGSELLKWEAVNWHLFKLVAVVTLILLELKRPPSRRVPTPTAFFENISTRMFDAQSCAVKQAYLVFKIEPDTPWIFSLAIVGEWWSFRISVSPKFKAPMFQDDVYKFLDEDNGPTASQSTKSKYSAAPFLKAILDQGSAKHTSASLPAVGGVHIPGPDPAALEGSAPEVPEATNPRSRSPLPKAFLESGTDSSPEGVETPLPPTASTSQTRVPNPTPDPIPDPTPPTLSVPKDPLKKVDAASLKAQKRDPDRIPASRVFFKHVFLELDIDSEQPQPQLAGPIVEENDSESEAEEGSGSFNNFPFFDPSNPEADDEGETMDPSLTITLDATPGEEFVQGSSADDANRVQEAHPASQQDSQPSSSADSQPQGRPKSKTKGQEKSPHPIRYLQHPMGDNFQATFVWKLRDALPPANQWSKPILFGTPASNLGMVKGF